MNGKKHFCVVALILGSFISYGANLSGQDAARRTEVLTALRDATSFYRSRVASHGGYVYFYSHDLSRRWGEGVATADQIWVQPPGTPTVGMAYLSAYEATGEQVYLEAATAAAEALVYGQLASGGWTNLVDFDPHSRRVAKYRNGKGGGKNISSFDDGQSQSALRLLINVDQALDFKHGSIHEAVQIGLDAVLGAQFPNGAFPQVWTGPVEAQPALKANYPGYDFDRRPATCRLATGGTSIREAGSTDSGNNRRSRPLVQHVQRRAAGRTGENAGRREVSFQRVV